jgi:hypothetical protein
VRALNRVFASHFGRVIVDTPAEISEWLYNMSADLAIRPVSS